MADFNMIDAQNNLNTTENTAVTTQPSSTFERTSNSIPKFFGDVSKLVGKQNYVQWSHRVRLALLKTRSARFINPDDTIPSDPSEAQSWHDFDGEIAACILDTTADHIATACMSFITDLDHERRTSDLWTELQRVYGSTGAQQAFILGRQFIQNKCGSNDNVVTWVDTVMTQYQELKVLKFDLDTLCVNVLLSGLPNRFLAFIDQTWTDDDAPNVQDLRATILRIDSAHQSRRGFNQPTNSMSSTSSTALVSKSNPVTSPDSSLEAYYAGLRKSGKQPSKEHPCSRCGSSGHWVIDCRKKYVRRRGTKKDGEETESNKVTNQAAVAVAELQYYPSETALMAEVLMADASDTNRSSEDWILDSGATEHMTGDVSLLEYVQPPPTPTTVSTADGILNVTGVGQARLRNHNGKALRLARVYLVKGLRFNLMSVRQFTDKGAVVSFKNTKAKVFWDGRLMLDAQLRQKTWVANVTRNEPLNRICLALSA